jgi:hypothetical protein
LRFYLAGTPLFNKHYMTCAERLAREFRYTVILPFPIGIVVPNLGPTSNRDPALQQIRASVEDFVLGYCNTSRRCHNAIALHGLRLIGKHVVGVSEAPQQMRRKPALIVDENVTRLIAVFAECKDHEHLDITSLRDRFAALKRKLFIQSDRSSVDNPEQKRISAANPMIKPVRTPSPR